MPKKFNPFSKKATRAFKTRREMKKPFSDRKPKRVTEDYYNIPTERNK